MGLGSGPRYHLQNNLKNLKNRKEPNQKWLPKPPQKPPKQTLMTRSPGPTLTDTGVFADPHPSSPTAQWFRYPKRMDQQPKKPSSAYSKQRTESRSQNHARSHAKNHPTRLGIRNLTNRHPTPNTLEQVVRADPAMESLKILIAGPVSTTHRRKS